MVSTGPGPKRKGKPPSKLTGQMPVSAERSPWWERVASEMNLYGLLVDMVFTIEEITQMIPPYPDKRQPRPRTVARRLTELNAIELVERGTNGSKGNGAKYKILPEPSLPPAGEPLPDNSEFLEKAVERMTRTKGKK